MDYREIPLTKGLVARVSPQDYAALAGYSWQAMKSNVYNRTFYAKRGQWDGERLHVRTVLMHREITGAPEGMVVMHLDGDGLNNTRPNLRVATNAANVVYDRAEAERKRVRRKLEKRRDALDFHTRVRTLDARFRGMGLTSTDVAEAAGLSMPDAPARVSRFLAGSERSPVFLRRLESLALSLDAAPSPSVAAEGQD